VTIAVIPTRDEPDTIADLVRAVLVHVEFVMVIDDSTDITTELEAVNAGATVRRGFGSLGAAIMTGMAYAANGCVVIDAGGSHDPDDIPRLVTADVDVAVGSRLRWGSVFDATPRRRAVTKITAASCRLVTGWPVRDWTSGFRYYSPRAVRAVLNRPPRAKGHAWQIEALHSCLKAGCSWEELPITYRASTSSLSTRTAWEAAVTCGRLAWR
jgi:dolichol-phosphate mannosyltransferase